MNVDTSLLDVSLYLTKMDGPKKSLGGPLRLDYFAARAVFKGQKITPTVTYITEVTPITGLTE